MAVNREYASADSVLGGVRRAGADPAGQRRRRGVTHARVIDEPLSLERLAALVGPPGRGRHRATFQGTTRDVERLEYEAYREMAEERIAAIVADAIERHGLEAAAAEHRIGTVPLGEASVAVAVSAAHRGEAFAGAREIIDRIKAEAPIWKKEVDAGEERWVEGAPPRDDGRAGDARGLRALPGGRAAAPGGSRCEARPRGPARLP